MPNPFPFLYNILMTALVAVGIVHPTIIPSIKINPPAIVQEHKQKLGSVAPPFVEVPKYVEDTSSVTCYKNGVQITVSEYKSLDGKLVPGKDNANCIFGKKLNPLQPGQYYKTGLTDAGSTTAQIVKKLEDGTSTTTYETK